MKSYKQLAFALCVSLVLSVLFSVPVSAETKTPFDTLSVTTKFYYGDGEQTVLYSDGFMSLPEVSTSKELIATPTAPPYYRLQIALYNEDGSMIYKRNTEHNIVVEGISFGATTISRDTNTIIDRDFSSNLASSITYRYQDVEGNLSQYYNISADEFMVKQSRDGSQMYNITLNDSLRFDSDVSRVFFIINYQNFNNGFPAGYETECTFYMTTDGFAVSSEQIDPKVGLLENIRNMLNSIGMLFSNLLNQITELPNKIWSLIETGLLNLFVPGEDSITSWRNNIDLLLSQKLGAVYQAGELIRNSFESLQNADATDSIFIPVTTLDSAGIPFSFGGYTVAIVPEKFGFLAEVCKKLTSIVVTLAFVNGLSKRYNEVMGVDS